MELSGLIFVALALVWAIVLIPMALKHHDEVAKTRSVDKFSDDMRVLARREAVSERESRLVVGRNPANRPVQQSAALAPASASAERAPATRQRPTRTTAHARSVAARRRAAQAAAKRRRVILAVLLLADAGVGAGVLLGWFLTWAPAVPVALTLLFLVVARFTVRREQTRWSESVVARRDAPAAPVEVATRDQRPSVVQRPRAVGREVPAETTDESTPAAPVTPDDRGLAVVTGLDDTSSFPVGLVNELEPTLDAGALWDPLPMTLPTYVTKPRAARSVRTIDLQASGVSSSGRDAGDSALVAEAATPQPEADEARKAVGS